MRKDIGFDIDTGDLILTSDMPQNCYLVNWIECPKGMEQRYLYGEVILPVQVSDKTLRGQGLAVTIPYTPIYKEIKLRFIRTYGELVNMAINPVDGSSWFTVQASMYGDEKRNVFASELSLISEDSCQLVFDNGSVLAYSLGRTDCNIVDANTQNKYFMLACNPGNNYRYPLTGVGLIRWVNSKANMPSLSTTLQQEFTGDGTPVKEAGYDNETNKLTLIVDTTSVDTNGNIQG